jgi:PIN domain nuclease of toxin-antitoxin system
MTIMIKGRSFLLDTMAILWFAFLPKRLPRAAREAILDDKTQLAFSTVSLWEIGLKMSVGGYRDFKLPEDWEHCIPEGLKQQAIIPLGIDAVHCRRIQNLPFHHRDPFDRMLIAQCQTEGMPIISSDAIFETYGIKRVW